MSELINNSEERKAILKRLILKLHTGESQETVRQELIESLSQIPYGEVVEVEQELISEGLPESEVMKLCDVHSAVLDGNIDLTGAQNIPEGHPVDVFVKENDELKKVTYQISKLLDTIEFLSTQPDADRINRLRGLYNQLFDVDKHYQRKEYLLFPYLEKQGITGPPKVMWGKQDEIRELIKGSIEILQNENLPKEDFKATGKINLSPSLYCV